MKYFWTISAERPEGRNDVTGLDTFSSVHEALKNVEHAILVGTFVESLQANNPKTLTCVIRNADTGEKVLLTKYVNATFRNHILIDMSKSLQQGATP